MNTSPDLNFKGNDPGAVRFGNFINYYKFQSSESRIKQLPETDIWFCNSWPFVVLDIGCNTGELTNSLLPFLKNNAKCSKNDSSVECYILGVDIDNTLITRAIENNAFPEFITYKCLDIMVNEQCSEIDNFLALQKKKHFDVVFCLSITMWIHLNHGDDGLVQFLLFICSKAELVIIEPQPWKCYKTAVRRLKRCQEEFPYFNCLKVRENVDIYIQKVLEVDCGFCKIYETDETKWGRKLLIFKKL